MEAHLVQTSMPTYSRALSDNELSYFLPSRANGANDMVVQVIFRSPAVLMTHWRVSLAWAIMRMQHPLLASKVEITPGEYHSARFVYTPPPSPHDAILDAESNLILRSRTGDELADDAVNEPRVLTAERTSYLFLSEDSSDTAPVREYSFVMHFGHYSIDGIAAHSLIHILLTLVGGSAVPGQPARSNEDLEALLHCEWNKRWSSVGERENVIPVAAEMRLPQIANKFKVVASKVEHTARQNRFIGGHVFPRVPSKTQKCVTYSFHFTAAETALILAKCRAERATVSNAIFVICNFAWIRTMQNRPDYNPNLPTMMYSAVSLRQLFSKPESLLQPSPLQPTQVQLESFVFLAVSYFNAMLPAFIPSASPEPAVFWNRARWIREQFLRYMRSPMLVPRVHSMTLERGIRARRFAKEDDDVLMARQCVVSAAKSIPRPSPPAPPAPSTPARVQAPAPRTPSAALIGLSQLNNLDEIYLRNMYPSIDVSFVGGQTRKNKGGMLLFSHTFRGKLYLLFGWDQAGFEPGVVERFWESVQECAREFLVDSREGDSGRGRQAKL